MGQSTSAPSATPPESFQPPEPPLVDGYPRLAKDMSRRPAKIHLRTFRAEVIECQLHAQAEIIETIEELRQVQREDSSSTNGNQRLHSREWKRMAGFGKQHSLSTLLREQLDRYVDGLLRIQKLCSLPEPNVNDDLAGIQTFFAQEIRDGRALIGSDALTWGVYGAKDSYRPDLSAIVARYSDQNMLTRWTTDKLAVPLVRWIKPSSYKTEDPMPFDDTLVERVVSAIHCTLASAIPIVAVVILFNVGTTGARLAILAASNLVFVWALALLATRPRPAELFGASAAFLAVGVVFIASSGNGFSCPARPTGL